MDDLEILLVACAIFWYEINHGTYSSKGITGVSGAIGLPGLPGPPGPTLYSQVF